MVCEIAKLALAGNLTCEVTNDGARLTTHCLYPSFEAVSVYVVKLGDEFQVHDGAGAYRNAWAHGRDEKLITGFIEKEANRYHLKRIGNSLQAERVSADWLLPAMLAVANASASACNAAVAKLVAVAEEALTGMIGATLLTIFGSKQIAKDFSVRGKSGGDRHFDFAIRDGDRPFILINGIAPHHASISSKYVAFADTDADIDQKLAVWDRPLPEGDLALMQQVASLVPVLMLPRGLVRADRAVRH